MKTFAVVFLSFVLAPLSADAADEPQPPTTTSHAPAFRLPNQEGAQVSREFRARWVVLYFYPKDCASGFTIEAHNFQRDIDKYTQKNAVILGVSVDNVGSHQNFCTKEGLNFSCSPIPATWSYNNTARSWNTTG
jgi:thioredoxin-dependent peroxiredoxin